MEEHVSMTTRVGCVITTLVFEFHLVWLEVYGIEDDVVVGVLELNVENGERETFFSYDASNDIRKCLDFELNNW